MALTKVNSQMVSGGGMTVDTTGNVTFSQAAIFSYSANSNYATDGALSNYSSTNGVYLNGNAAGYLRLSNDGTGSTKIDLYGSAYSEPNIIKYITSGVERMRITASGGVGIGTGAPTGMFHVSGGGATATFTQTAAGNYCITSNPANNSNTYYHCAFNIGGVGAGQITSSGSSTTYSTSSDYRLKDNVAPMTGALGTVAKLKPVTYTWKSNGEDSQGFIAHELQAVVPDCVIGEKDAVNEDGSIKAQMVDTSFLVATLTAAIQELNAKVTALETKLAAK